MGKNSGIEWTDATWNPWRGCEKVSPGCKNCYMYREQHRFGKNPREVVRAQHTTFHAPAKWERWWIDNPSGDPKVKTPPPQPGSFIFTCSWSDWFIEDADEWRDEAWGIVRTTPYIYLILTKRPELIPDRLPKDWGKGYPNVWLGVSVERQDYMWRAERLADIPAMKRFISYEPALGPLEFGYLMHHFDWLISGGESGPAYRTADPAWFTSVRDQCKVHGTSYFHKQNGGTVKLDGSYGGHLLDGVEYREFPNV